MAWHDIWPKQRANVQRKKLSDADREYRQNVRKNKTKAAVKASNARISAERKEKAKRRVANAELIRKNAEGDAEWLDN